MFRMMAFLISLFFTASVLAAGPDLSPLTGSVDLGTVVVAVLSIAGLLALVYVTLRGCEMAFNLLKYGSDYYASDDDLYHH